MGKRISATSAAWIWWLGLMPGLVFPQAATKPEPPTLFRALESPEVPRPGFGEDLSSETFTVVILGGSDAAETTRQGWLESLLVAGHPEKVVRTRNMAWPADTVWRQQRPRNFFAEQKPDYGEIDGRPKVTADALLLWFGKAEALEHGEAGVSEFQDAYGSILDRALEFTGRIVVVVPPPFEDPLGLGFDLEKRNATLRNYNAAIRSLAEARGLGIVDLESSSGDGGLTRDGHLLNAGGHRIAAREIARAFGVPVRLPEGSGDSLRSQARAKDVLWRQFWVPSNWAFLYGNRQSQPSSRDHEDAKTRWFPGEIRAALEAVESAEEAMSADG